MFDKMWIGFDADDINGEGILFDCKETARAYYERQCRRHGQKISDDDFYFHYHLVKDFFKIYTTRNIPRFNEQYRDSSLR